jgi:WD40 repeat protein
MADFQRTRLIRFARLEENETPESRFWRRFKTAVVVKQASLASHIDFSATTPHDFCVTAGSRISIFDARANKERRTLSRFKDLVFSGTFRSDGRLVACGGAKGDVQIVDAKTKSPLRSYHGHTAPVHAVRFAPDLVHLFSAGDDKSVRFWDIPTASPISTLENAHDDYIRCCAVAGGGASGGGAGIWATGSYDHTVSIWDPRILSGVSSNINNSRNNKSRDGGEMLDSDDALDEEKLDEEEEEEEEDEEEEDNDKNRKTDELEKESQFEEMEKNKNVKDEPDRSITRSSTFRSMSGSGRRRPRPGSVLRVDHGEPVTQVILLPGGGSMMTAGGTTCKLWDLIGGGRLIHDFSAHQKLVTSLALDGTCTRLLSGGLDGLVKVYEFGAFQVTHQIRMGAPILSLAVSPDNSRLVVGTTDGSLHIRQRAVNMGESLIEKKEAAVLRSGSYRYFLRGRGAEASVGLDDAITVDKKPKLKPYDKFLKAFNHSAALKSALSTNSAIIAASMLTELIARQALTQALSGLRGDDELAEQSSKNSGGGGGVALLLTFLCRYIAHPKYSALLIDVANVALDLYAPLLGVKKTEGSNTSHESIESLLFKLQRKIKAEIVISKELLGVQGTLDLIMAASVQH